MKSFCNICKRLTDNLDRVYNMSNMKVISIFCIVCKMNKKYSIFYKSWIQYKSWILLNSSFVSEFSYFIPFTLMNLTNKWQWYVVFNCFTLVVKLRFFILFSMYIFYGDQCLQCNTLPLMNFYLSLRNAIAGYFVFHWIGKWRIINFKGKLNFS